MKAIYISTLCAKKTYGELFGYNASSPGFAVQKYHAVMTDGLAENNCEVTCITAPPVSRKNLKALRVKVSPCVENRIKFIYTALINVPLIKNITAYHGTKKLCLNVLNSVKDNEDAGIVLDLLCISACKGAIAALNSFNKRHDKNHKTVGIVTDLPVFMHPKTKNPLKNILNSLYNRSFNKIFNNCDAYVFLTKQTDELLNIKAKPFAVIEGQADTGTPDPHYRHAEKRICLYAGSLCKIYGITKLAEAFAELCREFPKEYENTELHIYGNGDAKEEIILFSEKNSSVKYCGVLPNNEIVAKEQEALLLINPRPCDGEYTKYSFPSKNIEYMSSGTAVLTTNLPGMPEEYKDYVYIIENDDKEGIKKALKSVLEKSDKEIQQKGLSGRRFVLEHKNGKTQARKILELLK